MVVIRNERERHKPSPRRPVNQAGFAESSSRCRECPAPPIGVPAEDFTHTFFYFSIPNNSGATSTTKSTILPVCLRAKALFCHQNHLHRGTE